MFLVSFLIVLYNNLLYTSHYDNTIIICEIVQTGNILINLSEVTCLKKGNAEPRYYLNTLTIGLATCISHSVEVLLYKINAGHFILKLQKNT